MKKICYLLPFAFLILLIGLLWCSLSYEKGKEQTSLVGKPMPEFNLPRLSSPSGMVKNKDILGKPLILNIWATWCVTCIAEHDFLLKLKQKDNMDIIGINYRDDRLDALDWLQKRGNPYNVVLFDQAGKAAVALGIYGTPETFIIDQQGIIRYRYAGMINQQIWENEMVPIFSRLNHLP